MQVHTTVGAVVASAGDEGLVITWQTVVGGVILLGALVLSARMRRRGIGR
ncbi:MAG: hypothetical protein AAGD33_22295 [Actinomycetota bacterium]